MLKVTAFKKNAIGTSLEILEQLYLYSVLHFFMVSLDKNFFVILCSTYTAQRSDQNKLICICIIWVGFIVRQF